jgi:hypothetical protein
MMSSSLIGLEIADDMRCGKPVGKMCRSTKRAVIGDRPDLDPLGRRKADPTETKDAPRRLTKG